MKKKALLVISILILSMLVACMPNLVHAQLIDRIQSATNTSTSSSFTVTMSSTPTTGNVLVVALGVYLTGVLSPKITPSITAQTGITWLDAGGIANSKVHAFTDVEMFVGVVTGTPSTTVTFSLTQTGGSITTYADTAVICEYSGLSTSYILSNTYDQQKTDTGSSSSPDTGLTGLTSYANELWVGCTLLPGYSQGTPTNSFTLVNDGLVYNGISLAYLEQIVTSTGTAESGTTGAGSGNWAGMIICLPYIPPPTPTPETSVGILGVFIAVTAALSVWTLLMKRKKIQ